MLPTPVPLDRFLEPVDSAAVASLKRELRIDGPMLLWVGNPAQPVKDLDTLFTAFALLRRDVPAAVLVLAGDFSAAPRYRERAEAADVASSVRLVGLVPHDRLPVFYQAADLYLHSSRYEGLAKVMVEAAASGTPIVSTAVPGIEAVLEENVSGLLAPIGDAAAIASRAAELLADPERRAEMGRQARRLARERFSRERQIAGVVSLWRRVAGAA
jgi:glycosyltransferase involved in cell wall biosynthesis